MQILSQSVLHFRNAFSDWGFQERDILQLKQLPQLNDDSKKIQTLLRARRGVLKNLVL